MSKDVRAREETKKKVNVLMDLEKCVKEEEGRKRENGKDRRNR